MDDILNANGFELPLRMAVFLRTATSEEMAQLLIRCKERRINDDSVTDQVWLRWVEVDREAAFKFDNGGTAVWWAWAKLDPAAAVAAAAPAGKEKLQTVIRSIGQGDHTAAIQLLSQYPAADTPEVWEGILDGLTKTDPGAAAALALEKNLKLSESIGGWTARQPKQALAWVRGLEDPIQRRRALDAAVKELTLADPAAALRESVAMPAGCTRTGRTVEALAALARTDPAAARNAAEALPSPADRQRALSELAESLATRDPAAALSILKDLSWQGSPAEFTSTYHSAEGPRSHTTYTGEDDDAISQLMQSAPEATANALAGMPPERQAPVKEAILEWAGRQPEAASQWLNGQPRGPAKDQAIQGLTEWLTGNSPEPDYEAALAWAAAASTSDLQCSIIENTLSRWAGKDWKAARAAVDRLPFPPPQREAILKRIN